MRDPKRIKPFLEKLGQLWETNCPDWRFGQLMVNFCGTLLRDPFFYEEDEFIDALKNYFSPQPIKQTEEEAEQITIDDLLEEKAYESEIEFYKDVF